MIAGAARVVVVGLGPAGASLLTAETAAAIARVPRRFVRTVRHPAVAEVLADAIAFDDVYDAANSLDEVYPAIVERLVAEARAAVTDDQGEVLYAVPGSPAVAERTVELLRADPRIELEVLPALSFLDLAWVRLGVDPLAGGVRLVDGHRFAVEAAGERGPLLVGQCDSQLVLSDIKLAVDDGPDGVTVLQRLGLPDESVFTVAWEDLDREVTPDHLTCLWIPALAAPVGAELVRLDELVRRLRRDCPWDRAQTHHSLTRHLLEETYEVLEAIEGLGAEDEGAEHLAEELGDLLFQVFLHAALATEDGLFTMADVARGIHDKLVYRHPHVFARVTAEGSPELVETWEELKRREKGRTSVMEGIPGHLPALLYAHKVQRKAASVGFDWTDVEGAWPKIAEEAAELRAALDAGPGQAGTDGVADELGDLLFAVVNVARHLDLDPETALRAATEKFRRRFLAVEALAAERGLDLSRLDVAALDRLWEQVKRQS